METFFQHLALKIQTDHGIKKKEAESAALKEIILSGLSRGGFLKTTPYLPEFDHIVKDCLYLCFMRPDDSIGSYVENGMGYVKNELDAAGVSNKISERKWGFRIETDPLNINILIIMKNYGFKPQISYQQSPVAYEIRSISVMPDSIRAEIQQYIEKEIRKESSPEKKKRKPVKNTETGKNKEPDKIQQLSLFDL